MKMSNQEIIEKIQGLVNFQKRENEYFEKTGKKMLQGRVKITYAIETNKDILRNALKHYSTVMDSINSEYRDMEAEKKAINEELEAAKKERRKMRDVQVIMLPGKTLEEYTEKVSELREIENDVGVYTIEIDCFDGLDLDSSELGLLMFMIA